MKLHSSGMVLQSAENPIKYDLLHLPRRPLPCGDFFVTNGDRSVQLQTVTFASRTSTSGIRLMLSVKQA
jgi:hypothetical protein